MTAYAGDACIAKGIWKKSLLRELRFFHLDTWGAIEGFLSRRMTGSALFPRDGSDCRVMTESKCGAREEEGSQPPGCCVSPGGSQWASD